MDHMADLIKDALLDGLEFGDDDDMPATPPCPPSTGASSSPGCATASSRPCGGSPTPQRRVRTRPPPPPRRPPATCSPSCGWRHSRSPRRCVSKPRSARSRPGRAARSCPRANGPAATASCIADDVTAKASQQGPLHGTHRAHPPRDRRNPHRPGHRPRRHRPRRHRHRRRLLRPHADAAGPAQPHRPDGQGRRRPARRRPPHRRGRRHLSMARRWPQALGNKAGIRRYGCDHACRWTRRW